MRRSDRARDAIQEFQHGLHGQLRISAGTSVSTASSTIAARVTGAPCPARSVLPILVLAGILGCVGHLRHCRDIHAQDHPFHYDVHWCNAGGVGAHQPLSGNFPLAILGHSVMRLLIINPNTSKGVTARIKAAADAAARPGDRFTTLCPTFGPELIVTDADADHASHAVLETVKAYKGDCDGIVLASFGNTGDEAVRLLRPDIPVIGIAAAAFSIASAVGGNFGIVTFGPSLVPALQAKAEEAGLGPKLLGTLAVDTDDFGDPGTVQDRYVNEMGRLCENMHERGASCVVMGGGPLAGMAAKLAPTSPVPLIDGTHGAINILRTLVGHRHVENAV